MKVFSKVYCDRVYILCAERFETGSGFHPQRHPRPNESRVPPPPPPGFDTIEHMTLLGHLKQLYGLGGTVLKWLTSYLSDCSYVVKVRDSLSNPVTNNCGVPQ